MNCVRGVTTVTVFPSNFAEHLSHRNYALHKSRNWPFHLIPGGENEARENAPVLIKVITVIFGVAPTNKAATNTQRPQHSKGQGQIGVDAHVVRRRNTIYGVSRLLAG